MSSCDGETFATHALITSRLGASTAFLGGEFQRRMLLGEKISIGRYSGWNKISNHMSTYEESRQAGTCWDGHLMINNSKHHSMTLYILPVLFAHVRSEICIRGQPKLYQHSWTLNKMSYSVTSDRLKKLKVPSLVYWRPRVDLIDMLKEMKTINKDIHPVDTINQDVSRGHNLRIKNKDI